MRDFVLSTSSWMLHGLLLSLLLWGAHRLLVRFRFSSEDRFLSLKVGIVALPLLCLLIVFWPSAWGAPGPVLPITAPVTDTKGPVVPVRIPGFQWFACIAALSYWTAVLLLLVRLGLSMWRLRSLSAGAEWQDSLRGVPVLLHDETLPPFTMGFRRPRILVPRELYRCLSEHERASVLGHELIHVRRCDHAFNVLREAVAVLFCFSPFMHALSLHFEADMELSCDSRLLAEGVAPAKEYGNLLLRLVQWSPRTGLTGAAGLFVSPSLITRRIEAMKNQTIRRLPFPALVLVLGFLGAGGLVAKALDVGPSADSIAGADWAASKDMSFSFAVKLVTPKSKHEVKSRVSLNYGETASVLMGGYELQLIPVEKPAASEMIVQVVEKTQNKVIYRSSAPLAPSHAVSVASELKGEAEIVSIELNLVQK